MRKRKKRRRLEGKTHYDVNLELMGHVVYTEIMILCNCYL